MNPHSSEVEIVSAPGGPLPRKATHGSQLRIGIVTGSGPDAGIDLWQKILKANRNSLGEGVFRGDIDAPHVTVLSVPELGFSMDIEKHGELVEDHLLAACHEISERCDLIGIACNTLHFYADRIAAEDLSARFVSMVEVVCEACRDRRLERLILLGSRQTMALNKGWSSYRSLKMAVKHVEVPDIATQRKLHSLIRDVKSKGADACVRKWREIRGTLKVPVVLLACTELPLVIAADRRQIQDANQIETVLETENSNDGELIEFLDPNRLLAEKLVRLSNGLVE